LEQPRKAPKILDASELRKKARKRAEEETILGSKTRKRRNHGRQQHEGGSIQKEKVNGKKRTARKLDRE